jgi:hypothetical protein
LIDNHAKAGSPEGFLEWHLHCPVFCQCVKDVFCFYRVIDAKQHTNSQQVLAAPESRSDEHFRFPQTQSATKPPKLFDNQIGPDD